VSADHFLDRVHSLAAIEALDPAGYADLLEPPEQFDDAFWAAALERIDAFATRVMKIRLEHADDLPAPTRKVFAQTIVAYANNLPLLAERAQHVARGEAAERVVEAARATLALREAIRTPVLERIRSAASAAAPEADRRARDRKLDDKQRKQWSAMRRELEAVAEDPARVMAPLEQRLATHEELIDEPEPEREPTLAELIELD